jgi:LysR family transcriptional regulator, transcriptional activator of nhaA
MLILNLHHLYYFWMVAREGSVTRACEKLFLSQSTVSGQLIQLEKFFGIPLFERHGKRLILSREGRIVFQYAGDIFSQSQALVDLFKKGFREEIPPLRIGIDSQISKNIVVRLLANVQKKEPALSVHLWEANFKELLRRLRMNDVDLVLSDQLGIVGSLEETQRAKVGSLEIFFVAAPSVARRIKSFPVDLARVPLLLPTSNSPIWGLLQQCLLRWGVEPQTTYQLPDLELLHAAALAGLGVAPLHDVSAGNDLKAGRLKRLGHRSTGVSKTFWLIARKLRHPHPMVRYLLDHFRL